MSRAHEFRVCICVSLNGSFKLRALPMVRRVKSMSSMFGQCSPPAISLCAVSYTLLISYQGLGYLGGVAQM
jgi:hypothetical protein